MLSSEFQVLTSGRSLNIRQLGAVEYSKVWQLQKELQAKLISGSGSDTLITCSHDPVFTLGRSTKREHLASASNEQLESLGYKVFEVERGGSVTYHGPEQLMAYPIIDLKNQKRDVGWYMRQLEEVIIRTLADFNIDSHRSPERTGVWTWVSGVEAKIAFIGVRISRWCTLHGLSISLNDCTKPFQLINPCGLGDIKVTSISEIIGHSIPQSQLEKSLIHRFQEVFGYQSL